MPEEQEFWVWFAVWLGVMAAIVVPLLIAGVASWLGWRRRTPGR